MPQNHVYTYYICWTWYNGSYTMATKPIKFLELHYTTTKFLIIQNIAFCITTGQDFCTIGARTQAHAYTQCQQIP